MAEATMIAKGINGQIELLGNKIRISRKGALSFLTQGMKGQKEILISQISSIQFKNAGAFSNGYIQFAFMGGQEAKGGIFQATRDENSVMFKKNQQASFLHLKEAIDKVRDAADRGSGQTSDLDELEKLASLRDRGIITDEEFEAKKKQLLGL